MNALILSLAVSFFPNLPVPTAFTEPVSKSWPDLKPAAKSAEEHPFSLGLGYSRLKGTLGKFSFDRSGLVLNLGFDAKRFSLFGRMTVGSITCDFTEASGSYSIRGLVHDGDTWMLNGSPSIAGGIGIPLLNRNGTHQLTPHFEFEASLGRTKFGIDHVDGQILGMNLDLTEELSKRAAINFMWSRVVWGLTYALNLGHFSRYLDGLSPFITIGDGLFNASLDIELDDETKKLLATIGFAGETSHVLAEGAPSGAVGFNWNPPILGRRYTLSAEGLAIPVKGDLLLTFTGLLSVSF